MRERTQRSIIQISAFLLFTAILSGSQTASGQQPGGSSLPSATPVKTIYTNSTTGVQVLSDNAGTMK